MEYAGVSVIESKQSKGVTPKMRGRKFRSGVYCQGVLKKQRRKKVGRKTATKCIKVLIHMLFFF
jgi:hypothetical protein